MFEKVFGGPVVQLVEQRQEQLVFQAKRKLKVGQDQAFKVAGQSGKPAKVRGLVTSLRALSSGGFLATAQIKDLAHQRELNRLGAYSSKPAPGARQEPRQNRRITVETSKMVLTTVDVSSGGMQVVSDGGLTPGEVLKLHLMPNLSCDARVAWCAEGRAGLSFCETDDATKLLVSHFASGRAVPSAQKSVKRTNFVPPPSYQALD